MFMLYTNKIQVKKKPIDFVNWNQQNYSKRFKPSENQSIAKLGTTKSCNQIITSFNFSKTKTMYRIYNITVFDMAMTESFQTMVRAIWKPNSIHYINISNSQNGIDIEIHTWMTSRQLGYDILELMTAVTDSTFLKMMEPVVFCFLSFAWSLSLWLVNTATWFSNALTFDWSKGTSI